MAKLDRKALIFFNRGASQSWEAIFQLLKKVFYYYKFQKHFYAHLMSLLGSILIDFDFILNQLFLCIWKMITNKESDHL